MFLIINIGSTTVKSQLFNSELNSLAQIKADYSTLQHTVISITSNNEASKQYEITSESVECVIHTVIQEWKAFIDEQHIVLTAIGHRIVHGGSAFSKATRINLDMMESLLLLDTYAPQHNPVNRLGVQVAQQSFLNIPQYAVFDTAFHHTLPEYANRYPLPDHLLPEVAIKRYGFHGISCAYAVNEASKILNCADTTLNLIVLHLGGGSSATAIQSGVSIDTTMGFSPLGGLIMNTRSGDLDPMLLLTLLDHGITTEQLGEILQKKSGLSAIAGTGDMRIILGNAAQGDTNALLAIDMYCYQIKKIIGAYQAVLGSISALIFTGGIGENCPEIRRQIVQGIKLSDLTLNKEKNNQPGHSHADIAISHCTTRCLIIQCSEEQEIARQIMAITA
ncbi:MAG: acetate/propionate family kinase [Gammaproteobacteria bacterium]|nr:acetate/propionate family kinase [Gammaproteobacteria bacterium]